MCALKLMQLNINSGVLSSTRAQEAEGRNMRVLCQTGGRGESQAKNEGRHAGNDKISPVLNMYSD